MVYLFSLFCRKKDFKGNGSQQRSLRVTECLIPNQVAVQEQCVTASIPVNRQLPIGFYKSYLWSMPLIVVESALKVLFRLLSLLGVLAVDDYCCHAQKIFQVLRNCLITKSRCSTFPQNFTWNSWVAPSIFLEMFPDGLPVSVLYSLVGD